MISTIYKHLSGVNIYFSLQRIVILKLDMALRVSKDKNKETKKNAGFYPAPIIQMYFHMRVSVFVVVVQH